MSLKKQFTSGLLLFYLHASSAVGHQWGYPPYKQFTNSDGLNSNHVKAVIQDQTGLMWIGTSSGLTRFDGYTFTRFGSNTHQHRLSQSNIQMLFEDSQGYIWAATSNGVNRINPRTDEVKLFISDENDENSISDNAIDTFFESKEGELWIGTYNGLNLFKPETQNFERYFSDFDTPQFNTFPDMIQGKDGNLWLSSYRGGLFQFDTTAKTFEKIHLKALESFNNTIGFYTLKLDKKNRLWMATEAGLLEYNTKTKQSRLHLRDNHPNDANEVYIDASNQLWVGFEGGGLCRFNPEPEKWHCLSQETLGFPGKRIRELYQSNDGILWVGTQTEGLLLVHLKSPFRLIRFDRPHHSVWAVEKDHLDRLWIGTQGGALRIDQNDHVTQFHHDKNNINSLKPDAILDIFSSNNKQIWLSGVLGLNRYDLLTDQIRSVDIQLANNPGKNHILMHAISKLHPSELLLSTTNHGLLRWDMQNPYAETIPINLGGFTNTNPDSFGIFIDSQGRYWTFGFGYLAYLDQKTNELIMTEDIVDGDPYFMQMAEDSNGQRWSLSFDGLFKINAEGKAEQRFGKDKFGNATLADMALSGNHLWIGSNEGLWQFSLDTQQVVRHFLEADGLQSNNFSESSYVDTDGTVFMGGSNGITVFHPDNIENIQNKPLPVVLTNLSINNIYVDTKPDDENSPLTTRLAYLDHLILEYAQSHIFSLEFSALDYSNPNKNQYAYKLDGFKDDWIYTNASNRRATFTSLSPGIYTFHVRTGNDTNALHNDGTSLRITILPPWWRTYWAYFIYSVLFISSILWFIRYRTAQSRLRAIQLEHEVELRTQELKQRSDELQQRTKEINQQKNTIEGLLEKKNTLFANVSHEFRTPLTLIIGPIKSLLNRYDKDTDEKLRLINRSAHRLQGLVEQLLLFSKLSNFESTQATPCSVKQVIEITGASLRSLMDDHQLQLSISAIEDTWVKLTPNDALQTILGNLLSNAAKYTPSGGNVAVNAYTDNTYVHIKVRDSGPGVPNEWQDKIFERFIRITEHIKAGIPGTGLGLALVKELVEINRGQISVMNSDQGGAVFEFVLPIYIPTDEEIQEYSFINAGQVTKDTQVSESSSPATRTHDLNKPTAQIIDDTADMRAYLYEELKDGFNLLLSEDGETGLQSIRQHHPDIVICDIMMPGIDGLEVLKRLRADIEISHTPLILLTAKDDKEYRMKGYEEQADDYVTKPFAADELKARLHNILNIRKTWQKQAQAAMSSTSANKHILVQNYEASEKKFLEKFKNILDQHYQDPELNIDAISDKIHISKSALNRKINALLGYPPFQYLRIYRLEKAAQILKTGYEGNLGMLADATGFSSQQHFSSSFKEHFGASPKDYIKQTKV